MEEKIQLLQSTRKAQNYSLHVNKAVWDTMDSFGLTLTELP